MVREDINNKFMKLVGASLSIRSVSKTQGAYLGLSTFSKAEFSVYYQHIRNILNSSINISASKLSQITPLTCIISGQKNMGLGRNHFQHLYIVYKHLHVSRKFYTIYIGQYMGFLSEITLSCFCVYTVVCCQKYNKLVPQYPETHINDFLCFD